MRRLWCWSSIQCNVKFCECLSSGGFTEAMNFAGNLKRMENNYYYYEPQTWEQKSPLYTRQLSHIMCEYSHACELRTSTKKHTKIFAKAFKRLQSVQIGSVQRWLEHLRTFSAMFRSLWKTVGNLRKWRAHFRKSQSWQDENLTHLTQILHTKVAGRLEA